MKCSMQSTGNIDQSCDPEKIHYDLKIDLKGIISSPVIKHEICTAEHINRNDNKVKMTQGKKCRCAELYAHCCNNQNRYDEQTENDQLQDYLFSWLYHCFSRKEPLIRPYS